LRKVISLVICLTMFLVVVPMPASAATVQRTVVGNEPGWKDTGITILPGQVAVITATGEIALGWNGVWHYSTPDGTAGSSGNVVQEAAGGNFLAPGLFRWSLVGKVGAEGTPFFIGSGPKTVTTPGTLYLAYNDDWWEDNIGSYTVSIEITTTQISATLDIKPDTLNLKSQGGENSVTAYVELPTGFDVSQIDVSTVRLVAKGKTVNAQPKFAAVGDYDSDGTHDVMLKFSRQELVDAAAGAAGDMVVTVTGTLKNGTPFVASDTIQVVKPGK